MTKSEILERQSHWVQQWHESGLSATQFSKLHNIPSSNLYNWASRLRLTADKRPFPMARVVRRDSAVSATSSTHAQIVVEIGLARVVVSAGFDRATLAQVVDVLSHATTQGHA